MKKIVLLCFFITSFISYSQTTTNDSTLEIVGTAQMSVSPDVGILNLDISHIGKAFSQSIEGLNKKSRELTQQLKQIGYQESTIKTTNFDVRKNRIYRDNKSIDSGYVASQRLQLEFKNDKENIAKLLNQFSSSNQEFSLNFNFKLSEDLKAKVQNDIIKLATANAYSKAKLIAEAANVEIDGIQHINHGHIQNGSMRSSTELLMADAESTRSNMESQGFTASEVVYSDHILVIWKLK